MRKARIQLASRSLFAVIIGCALSITATTSADEPKGDLDDLPTVESIDLHAAPNVVDGKVLLRHDERENLRESLQRSIFRAEASHVPPEPYRATPMIYDGAVTAVSIDGRLYFVTSAGWLTNSTDIHLIDPSRGERDDRVPLRLERVAERFDLAFLTVAQRDEGDFVPVQLATETPLLSYALLSPQTKYEQLVSASVFAETVEDNAYYWPTTLAASNGYPLVDADGRLVAVHARRSPDALSGEAIGWPKIAASNEPTPNSDAHRPTDDAMADVIVELPTRRGDELQKKRNSFRHRFGQATKRPTTRYWSNAKKP